MNPSMQLIHQVIPLIFLILAPVTKLLHLKSRFDTLFSLFEDVSEARVAAESISDAHLH